MWWLIAAVAAVVVIVIVVQNNNNKPTKTVTRTNIYKPIYGVIRPNQNYTLRSKYANKYLAAQGKNLYLSDIPYNWNINNIKSSEAKGSLVISQDGYILSGIPDTNEAELVNKSFWSQYNNQWKFTHQGGYQYAISNNAQLVSGKIPREHHILASDQAYSVPITSENPYSWQIVNS